MPGIKQIFALKQKGFSLLELSIVLGIVGVLGAGSVMVYSEQNTHAKWQESNAKLKVVKSAILKFAEVNKYMPCPSTSATGVDSRTVAKGTIPAIPATPATPAIPKTVSAPTIPAIPSTSAQPAIPNIDVSTCSANSGMVPYSAIGLSRADVQDSWGNMFVYAVDQGVTDADEMLRCPTATACFFNGDPKPSLPSGKILPGSVLPAFNLSTEPLKGVLGANNLRVCADAACGTIEAEGLVAVLVALNENGTVTAGLSTAEADNQDNDTSFVNSTYSESPYYDDLVLSIAANEIKARHEGESVEMSVDTSSSGPTVVTGNDLQNMGNNTVGSSGTNVWTDDAIVNTVNQVFGFGYKAAGKEIVLTLDTHARGTWDQPTATNTSITSDTGIISANGNELEKYQYEYRDDSQTGYEEVTYNEIQDGVETGETITTTVDYWETSEEFIVQADADGNVDVEFLVATTANYETIDFTNIELIFYDTPPSLPEFPKVSEISGIPETEGLE